MRVILRSNMGETPMPLMEKVMSWLVEPARRVRVRERYDVVVVGGGIAGVAAAVAAAREGAKVALLEKEYGLGGLATLGNIVVYLPLCDGMGRQVSGGLAERLLKLSVADGSQENTPRGLGIPEVWMGKASLEERAQVRYVSVFNPATFALAMEELVLKQGVDLLYDTRFSGVHLKGGGGDKIEAVLVEDKGGRVALKCGAVVDATGDADVCLAAGEELAHCDVNVPCGWFYFINQEGKVELVKNSVDFDAGAVKLPKGVKKGFDLRDSRDATALTVASNRLVMEQIAKLKKERETEKITLLRPTSIASYRMTRRLVGHYELAAADDRKYFADTVGMVGHWRLKGPVYCVPLKSLAAVRTANLITAGRCISTTHDAWDMARVIPACAVTGEAAGLAATMLAKGKKKSFMSLEIEELRRRLKRRGVILDKRLVEGKGEVVDEKAEH